MTHLIKDGIRLHRNSGSGSLSHAIDDHCIVSRIRDSFEMRNVNPFPSRYSHTDALDAVSLQPSQPTRQEIGVAIPNLDSPLVYLSLPVLHRLFMDERALEHGNQRALRRKMRWFRDWDSQPVGTVQGKMCLHIEKVREMGAKMQRCDGDGMGAWVNRRLR